MTVQEAIEKLQKLNPDLVLLRTSGMGFDNVVEIDTTGGVVSLDEPDTPQEYAVIY